jgi:hypothetical protein
MATSALADRRTFPSSISAVDIVVMAVGRILLRQFQTLAVHVIDGADMHAVRADDFGMFLDLGEVGHGCLLE